MATKTKKKVTEDMIRKQAQKIYDERIKKEISGSAEDDWQQAKEVLSVK
jgi:hypothetical protein